MRPPERTVWRDASIVVLGTAIAAALCVLFDISEALRRWTAPWERFQLDELPAVLPGRASGLGGFGGPRYCEAGAGGGLKLSLGGEFGDLGEAVTLTGYRLIQEALTNVAKHAAAGQVTMRLERRSPAPGADDAAVGLITITIADDGVGSDMRAP